MDTSSSEIGKQSGAGGTQKWVLSVPVDCEGCRKKVTKILHSINGVESCEVDIKQHRVVVTGNMDAATLISMLIKKTGKRAELWPDEKTKKKKPKLQRHPINEEATVEEIEEQPEDKKKETAMELTADFVEKMISDGNKEGKICNEKIQHRVETPPVHDTRPPPPNPHHDDVNGQPMSTTHVPPHHQKVSMSPQANETCATATSASLSKPSPSYYCPQQPVYTSATSASLSQPPLNCYYPQQPVYTVSYNAAPLPHTSHSMAMPPRNAVPHSYSARPSTPTYYYSIPQLQQPVCTMNYNAAPQPQVSRSATQPAYYHPRPHNYYTDYQLPYDDVYQLNLEAYAYEQQLESLGMFSDENPNTCLIM